MDEFVSTFWHELLARPSGPMAFRFYLQPTMAILFAIRDGIHDERTGKPAYLWSLLTAKRGQRRQLLREGWHDGKHGISRTFYFALAMDVIYQLVVLKALHPLQSLVVAFTLALVPYTLLRGPANRIAHLASHTREKSHGR